MSLRLFEAAQGDRDWFNEPLGAARRRLQDNYAAMLAALGL